MTKRAEKKSLIVVGNLPERKAIEDRLAVFGIPVVSQSADEALATLFPKPYSRGEAIPATSLYVIGSDVPDVDRERLVEWLREEGGGPYLFVRTTQPTRDLPFHYIEAQQSADQVADLLLRYLDKI